MRRSSSPAAFSVSIGSPATPGERGGRPGGSETGETCRLIPEPAARARRRQPALARPGGGALAPPQPDAHFPRQGAGVEPGRSPRSEPAPSPPPAARRLSSAQTGGVSPPSPPPQLGSGAGPRAEGGWLPGCRGLEVPARPGAGEPGDRGRGAAARLRALPFFGEAPRSQRRGDPHPRRGHGRRRCLGTAPRGGPCAVPPHPVSAQHPPPPPASRGPSSAPHIALTDQETYFNCRVKHKSLGSKKPRLPPTNQLEREAWGTKDVKEN